MKRPPLAATAGGRGLLVELVLLGIMDVSRDDDVGGHRDSFLTPVFMHDLMHCFFSYHARVALPPNKGQAASDEETAM